MRPERGIPAAPRKAQARRTLDRARRERRRQNIGLIIGASMLTGILPVRRKLRPDALFVTSAPVTLNKGDKMILSDGGIWL